MHVCKIYVAWKLLWLFFSMLISGLRLLHAPLILIWSPVMCSPERVDPDRAWKGGNPPVGEVSVRRQRPGEDTGDAITRIQQTLNPKERKGKERLYLFKRALGIEQVVDHISRHTDEWGHTDAVTQDGGPRRIMVVEQLDLWREGQETDDDELDTRTKAEVS